MAADHDQPPPGQSQLGAAEDTITEQREHAQKAETEAHNRGETLTELAAFAKEIALDVLKFPSDVVEDARDPARREGEQQADDPPEKRTSR